MPIIPDKLYIIAEAGINHRGDLTVAAQMVEVAAKAGVDAVKFQSFSASGLTHKVLAADQHEFFSKYELSQGEHRELAAVCQRCGVDFMSTPFELQLVELLHKLGVPAFKIASCDLTNLPLIRHCAGFNKPLFISTGMGNLAEVKQAYTAAKDAGCPRVVLLQCTTNYPTAYVDVNLRMMGTMHSEVGCEVGFSDHSVGNYACFGAVALGASVIEKHFCLDKSATGPDIACSCGPDELADLVTGIRAVEASLGTCDKQMLGAEREVAAIARRSIFYAYSLPEGHVITLADLVFLRPASGMSPADVDRLLGNTLKQSVNAGESADPGHCSTKEIFIPG